MSEHDISRRTALRALGTLGVAGATGALVLRAPATAAEPQLGVHERVEDGLRRLFGNRPLKDGAALVKLGTPLIAENGAVVPVAVEVSSPMTAADHVTAIYLVADQNRIPIIMRASFTPQSGQAYLGATVRLGETGAVRAIVEQSDGTLLQVKREVKVTVSGCGG
ncbi:MAG TPA: thiosulfate oxidation carrier protein SoxY [Methylomirabilota bacterium]|jgi:sulfur-oxidizing protein SoxY